MGRKSKIITFHVGMPRVATTFMQREVFPKLDGVSTVCIGDKLCRIFDGEGPLLISSERLGGLPWSYSQRKMRPYPTRWIKTFKKRIENISSIYSESKVIFGIRKHNDIIKSIYTQYLKIGGKKSVDKFFHLENESFINENDLYMSKMINVIESQFDKIFIYRIKDIKNKPNLFYSKLANFVGATGLSSVEEKVLNQGLKTKIQVESARLLNRINHWIVENSLRPTLENRLFEVLGLTPRDISSSRMSRIPSPSFDLSAEKLKSIRSFYEEDWERVEGYLDKYGLSAVS